MPIKQIARLLNCSEQHAKRILKAQAYQPNRIGGTRISCETASSAEKLDLNGNSWRRISIELGYSVKALKRAIDYYAQQNTKQ